MQSSSLEPETVSIVIPLYNAWDSAERCIESLNKQRLPPFETIIIDDGSDIPTPPSMKLLLKDSNVKLLRIPHRGISTAKNTGLDLVKGELVLFIDSDCFLECSAIENLIKAANQHMQDATFQLRISGNVSTIIGTAEEIFQSTIQELSTQPDGRIRWLNTAGFAVRRQFGEQNKPLFDESIKRAEDTFLLANLIKSGLLPRFVPDSIVFHSPHLSLLQYIIKVFMANIYSSEAYARIKQMDIKIRIDRAQQRQVFQIMWKKSLKLPYGFMAFTILMIRYLIKIFAKKLHLKIN
jgi:glycosyltransferase involved in cell wall biosynthesis